MAIVVQVGGVNRTSYLKDGSLRCEKTMNGRDVLSCQFERRGGAWAPARGQDIQVQIDGAWQFGGEIQDLEMTTQIAPDVGRTYRVSSVGYSLWADRTLVSGERPAESLAGRAAWINTQFLARFGTTVQVQGGSPTVAAATYEYQTAGDALTALSRETGWMWMINYAKVLFFVPPGVGTVPTVLSDTNHTVERWSVREDVVQRVTLAAVRVPTPEGLEDGAVFDRTGERHDGDGARRIYCLKCYPLVQLPTSLEVHRAGGTTTEAIGAGQAWTFTGPPGLLVQQDVSATLQGGEYFLVNYLSHWPTYARVCLPEWPPLEMPPADAAAGTTINQALAMAQGILTQQSGAPKQIEVRTREGGTWYPPLAVNVDLAGVSTSCLITSVMLQHEAALADQASRAMVATLRLLEGGVWRGRWQDELKDLFGGGGGGATVGAGGGGGGGAAGIGAVVYPLGGSRQFGVLGTAYQPVAEYVLARVDHSKLPAGATLTAWVDVTGAGGTAVTPRIVDMTGTPTTVATGSGHSGATWLTQALTIPGNVGVRLYQLQVAGSDSQPNRALGYLYASTA